MRRVERRRLVLGEHPLPDRVGALRRVERRRPRSTARSCCCRRSRSGRTRSRSWPACGRVPRKCWPGPFDADRIERLAVLGQVDALDEDGHHPALVGVEDELLVADGEAALEPAGRVEDEVDAGEDRRLEGRGALVGGLRVGDLRGAQVAAGAERDAEPAGQRGHRRTGRARAPASRTSARPTASTSSSRTTRARPAPRAGRAARTSSRPAIRRASGRQTPAAVTGAIAPARMNGVMSVAWFASA